MMTVQEEMIKRFDDWLNRELFGSISEPQGLICTAESKRVPNSPHHKPVYRRTGLEFRAYNLPEINTRYDKSLS